MRRISVWAVLVLMMCQLSCAVLSCSSIDCPVQNQVAVNWRVMVYDDTKMVADTLKDTLYVWTQRADGTDTLLYNRGVNTHSFSLPMSYQHPEDILVLGVVDTKKTVTLDTVWLKKNDIPHFESVDCGSHFFHELTSVRSTHHAIDTVSINQSSVTYDPSIVHLHICFKASR